MIRQMFEPENVKLYRRFRAALIRLNDQIAKGAMAAPEFGLAANGLGISEGQKLIFETEDEISILMDYTIHEIGRTGARIIDRYRENPGPQDDLERVLLDAMVVSSVGLYRVEGRDAKTAMVGLKQLAPLERELSITDINLSRSVEFGFILFSRMVELPEMAMTGGAALPFWPESEAKLLKLWGGHERYRRIFKLHRRSGIPVGYAGTEKASRRPARPDRPDV